MSALGMLAEMAVKKYQEEKEKLDLDRMFGADGTPRKDGKEAAYEVTSRPESGFGSQNEDETDSDEDREDGRIFFRFEEYHELQQYEMQQQQQQQLNDQDEEYVNEETV